MDALRARPKAEFRMQPIFVEPSPRSGTTMETETTIVQSTFDGNKVVKLPLWPTHLSWSCSTKWTICHGICHISHEIPNFSINH